MTIVLRDSTAFVTKLNIVFDTNGAAFLRHVSDAERGHRPLSDFMMTVRMEDIKRIEP